MESVATNSFGLNFGTAFLSVLPVVMMLSLFGFWLTMLIDVIKRDFHNPNDKLLWAFLLVFTHIIGAFLYFFMVRQPNRG